MQTKMYLIRHGEVENPQGIIYGRFPNFGLSEKGKKEMEKTAEFLVDKKIDELYASPLLRAKQSAAIIRTKLGIKTIHISDKLLEVKTAYQGRKFSELDNLQSEVFLKPLSPSDETIEQLADRMLSFITEVINQHKDRHIAVVSHGDPIMALKAVIKNKTFDFYSFKTDNYVQHGEVYEITIDEDGTLSQKNVFKPQS